MHEKDCCQGRLAAATKAASGQIRAYKDTAVKLLSFPWNMGTKIQYNFELRFSLWLVAMLISPEPKTHSGQPK